MKFETLLYSVNEAVCTITLNRPERMNALTKILEAELRTAIEHASREQSVRAIVLTGAGRAFCAGMDMEELETLPPEDIQAEKWMRPFDMNRRADYQTRYSYFPASPKPIICAINGATAGLGLVMALYSDFRIASENAVFATAFAKRGLIAEHGIAWMLPRIVGHANATDLLLTSRKIDASEALRMGLINKVVEAEDLLADAMNERKAERAPGAVKAEQHDRQLHQVIAGDDDGDVKSHQKREIERHARRLLRLRCMIERHD